MQLSHFFTATKNCPNYYIRNHNKPIIIITEL